jgi:predicted phage terminase large subunit-like protein
MSSPTLELFTERLERVHRHWATPGELAAAVDPTTRQTPALELIDQALVDVENGECDRLIISMPPQEGKALALDTPIATPTGWTTMGDIEVGDQVFDRHGNQCTVTWTSPVWTGRPCLTVRTGDGERIVADADHEWVARLDRRRGERTVETRVLAEPRSKNAQITAPSELRLPHADLPLDPYLLGSWLGDGTSTSATITIADPEIADRIRAAGYPCRKMTAPYRYSLAPEGGSSATSPVRQALQNLNVWGNKHIPVQYLRASTEQRLALLQGLVDTDGHVTLKGQVEYTSISRRLADDVRELVYTLGAKATITEDRARLNGRDIGPRFRVRFYRADAAWLPRHRERCKNSSVALTRYVWAEPAATVPVRCIEVDSPSHTYLAGRSLLPTHNSTRVTKVGPLWALTRNPDRRIVVVSYGADLANEFGRDIRSLIVNNQGDEGALDLGLRIAPDNGAVSSWRIAGHRGGVRSIGLSGGITGRPADWLFIDDPVTNRVQAESEAYRRRAKTFWTSTGSTRLAPGAPVVLVLTRWHEDDLAGWLLGREDGHRWRVINIPAQADHDPAKGETDPLGREPGEFMLSARVNERTGQPRGDREWEQVKVQAGTRDWNALYQGRPAPVEGGVWKRPWWRQYASAQWIVRDDGTRWIPNVDEVIHSWDMAFKDTDGSDYVVGLVLARRGTQVYAVDMIRARLDFVATKTAVQNLAARWPQAIAKVVEDKANGTAVINMLRRTVPGLIPVEPDGSKLARASAVAPFIEAGQVWLPDPLIDGCAWVVDLVDEAAAFPNGAHDDAVDAMSQGLNRLLLSPLLAGDDVYEPDDFDDSTISPY